MNFLKVLTIDQSEEWDKIVRSFDNYDVYYLSGYVKAFQIHGDGEPLLFYYEDKDIRGVNVVMKRIIPNTPYFDFSSPYGYGGWNIIGDGNKTDLYNTYIEWCKENNIISEFIRFELFSNSKETYYGDVIPRTTNVVRSLYLPMEGMLMDFDHKVRKNYKRALANNLECIIDTTGEYLKDFLKIYYSTMDRNDAKDEYYFKENFYNQINTLKGNFAYFHVLYENKIISTELVIMGSDSIYSYLGGTDNEYYELRPNDYLKVKIIEWGIEKGYKQFVLGGGYGSDDGIFRYKKAFAPNGIYQFYTGQTIFNQKVYDELVKQKGEIKDEKFFPLYRA